MACVFLMSDGVGDFIKNSDIVHLLNKNILEKFDQTDLQDVVYPYLTYRKIEEVKTISLYALCSSKKMNET